MYFKTQVSQCKYEDLVEKFFEIAIKLQSIKMGEKPLQPEAIELLPDDLRAFLYQQVMHFFLKFWNLYHS